VQTPASVDARSLSMPILTYLHSTYNWFLGVAFYIAMSTKATETF